MDSSDSLPVQPVASVKVHRLAGGKIRSGHHAGLHGAGIRMSGRHVYLRRVIQLPAVGRAINNPAHHDSTRVSFAAGTTQRKSKMSTIIA